MTIDDHGNGRWSNGYDVRTEKTTNYKFWQPAGAIHR